MGESEELRGIADVLRRAAGPNVGFALFVTGPPERTSYVSNANRDDVAKALDEWLTRTASGGPPRVMPGDRRLSSHETDARLALERRCVEIGKTIAIVPHVEFALFLFDFGDKGHFAYFTTDKPQSTRMRDGIAAWVRSMRGHGQA